MSRHSLVKARSFYVAIKYFCVATEFGLDRGFWVATEYFLVAAEFGAKAKRINVATELLEICFVP